MANGTFDLDELRDLIRETVKAAVEDAMDGLGDALTDTVEAAAESGASSAADEAVNAANEAADAAKRLHRPELRVMYVVSQAKRCIVPAICADVVHRPKERQYKYWLRARSADGCCDGFGGDWVGKYETYEEASAALCGFAEALVSGVKLYYVK